MKFSFVIPVVSLGVLAVGCAGAGGTDLRSPVSSGSPGSNSNMNPAVVPLHAVLSTEAIVGEVGDSAIWSNTADPTRSEILVTDMSEKSGGLVVFDTAGKQTQKIDLKEPCAVDVLQGATVGGKPADLAVVVERGTRTLKIFTIDPASGKLTDVTAESESAPAINAAKLDVQVSLVERKGELGVFVTPASTKEGGDFAQFKLVEADGKFTAKLVRVAGGGTEKSQPAGIAVDPDKGTIYFADEKTAIKRASSDPEAKAVDAPFAKTGYTGSRGAMEVVKIGTTTYLFSLEKLPGGSKIHAFKLGGKEPKSEATIMTSIPEASGFDATTKAFGKEYPEGALVIVAGNTKSVQLFDLREVIRAIQAAR